MPGDLPATAFTVGYNTTQAEYVVVAEFAQAAHTNATNFGDHAVDRPSLCRQLEN
jgi:hypothetical protein